MPRRDDLYLADIVDSANQIAEYIAGLDYEAFYRSNMVRDAAERRLIIIGEAIAGLPQELKDRHQHLPWRQAKALRNQVVHRYFGIDWKIVWKTVTEDLPILSVQIAKILNEMDSL